MADSQSSQQNLITYNSKILILADCDWCRYYAEKKTGFVNGTYFRAMGIPAGRPCGRLPGSTDNVRECKNEELGTYEGPCWWQEHDPNKGGCKVYTHINKDGTTRLMFVVAENCVTCSVCPSYVPPESNSDAGSWKSRDVSSSVSDFVLVASECDLCAKHGRPPLEPETMMELLHGKCRYLGNCKDSACYDATVYVNGNEYACAWEETDPFGIQVAYGVSRNNMIVELLGVGADRNKCGLCGCDHVLEEWQNYVRKRKGRIISMGPGVPYKHYYRYDEDDGEYYFTDHVNINSGFRTDDKGKGCWNLNACIAFARIPIATPSSSSSVVGNVTANTSSNSYSRPASYATEQVEDSSIWDLGWFYSVVTCDCKVEDITPDEVELSNVPGYVWDARHEYVTYIPITDCHCPDLKRIVEDNPTVFNVVNLENHGNNTLYYDSDVKIVIRDESTGSVVETDMPIYHECRLATHIVDFRTMVVQLEEDESAYPIYAITPCPDLGEGLFREIVRPIKKYGLKHWNLWTAYVTGVHYDSHRVPVWEHEGEFDIQGWHKIFNPITGGRCESGPGIHPGDVPGPFAYYECDSKVEEYTAYIKTSRGLLTNTGDYTSWVTWRCLRQPCYASTALSSYDDGYRWWPYSPSDLAMSCADMGPYQYGTGPACPAPSYEGCNKEAWDMFCTYGPGWYCVRWQGDDYFGFDLYPQCPDSDLSWPDPEARLYRGAEIGGYIKQVTTIDDLCCLFGDVGIWYASYTDVFSVNADPNISCPASYRLDRTYFAECRGGHCSICGIEVTYVAKVAELSEFEYPEDVARAGRCNTCDCWRYKDYPGGSFHSDCIDFMLGTPCSGPLPGDLSDLASSTPPDDSIFDPDIRPTSRRTIREDDIQ